MPYHGIISRGLMSRANRVGIPWRDVAPALEVALGERYQGWGGAALGGWTDDASAAGVLTFRQSAAVAISFVEKYGPGVARLLGAGPNTRYGRDSATVLWSVKEGHTSSVWRVELRSDVRSPAFVFGLNVSRDRAAGAELATSTEAMARARQLNPSGVVRVLGCESVGSSSGPAGALIPVIAVEWLPDAVELHLVRPPREGAPRFMCVEAFSTGQRMVGTVLGKSETDRVWWEIIRRQVLHTTFAGSDLADPCRAEINDGDWVLHRGTPILVGASDPTGALTVGEWIVQLLLTSGEVPGSTGRRLYWGDHEAALDAIRAGLEERDRPGPTFRSAMAAAGRSIESRGAQLNAEKRQVVRDALRSLRRMGRGKGHA